jgi:hypothetical protein
MDDDDLMIIGAKKNTKAEKDYDKHDTTLCINNFKKYILSGSTSDNTISQSRDSFVEMSINGDADKNFIRPTLWKIFLGVYPIESPIEEWVNKTAKIRNEFKQKLKCLTTLKKFSGDPLGNQNDV